MSMNKQVVTKNVQEGNSKKSLPKRTNGRATNHSAVPKMILLSEIEPDPENVRQQADEDDFMDLVNSIKEIGVLQAILLRTINSTNGSKTKYRIVAGERRFRAAKRAGLTEIPALIVKMNEGEALGAQLIELSRANRLLIIMYKTYRLYPLRHFLASLSVAFLCCKTSVASVSGMFSARTLSESKMLTIIRS
jgi:ParB-like nuclease family protein